MARSLYVQSLFNEAYDFIDHRDEKAFNAKLHELIDILGADDPDVTGLKIEHMRRQRLLTK